MDQVWKSRVGATPSQQGTGIAKGRNQGRGGEIQITFQVCACVFAWTHPAAGFSLDPL